MEFIPLKKIDAKGRFNFRREGPISQRRGIFVAEGHFRSLFRNPFHNCEMRRVCCEMALVCQRGVSRFGDFTAISQLQNEGRRLQNSTHVPRGAFAAAKTFVEGGMGLRNDFTTKWHFRSGFLGLRNNFAAKWRFHRGLFCFATKGHFYRGLLWL